MPENKACAGQTIVEQRNKTRHLSQMSQKVNHYTVDLISGPKFSYLVGLACEHHQSEWKHYVRRFATDAFIAEYGTRLIEGYSVEPYYAPAPSQLQKQDLECGCWAKHLWTRYS